ncbi:Uncharacterised protein [Clostridium disporicum]|nr:Uncharacterised protein [Clostridium disporicum]
MIPQIYGIIFYEVNVSKNERLTIRGEFKRKYLINGLKSLLNMYH